VTGRTEVVHATAVAHAGRAVLITGPSGTGKSALALRMIALGARLVSDDRTRISRLPVAPGEPAGQADQGLVASCPSDAIRGLIEVRGLGLLRTDPAPDTPLALVADLSGRESERLPPRRAITLLGLSVPLVLQPQSDHFAEALLLYLSGGRQA
jgi:HPr kinase/phosphorylase